jgi:hypothetical protein
MVKLVVEVFIEDFAGKVVGVAFSFVSISGL